MVVAVVKYPLAGLEAFIPEQLAGWWVMVAGDLLSEPAHPGAAHTDNCLLQDEGLRPLSQGGEILKGHPAPELCYNCISPIFCPMLFPLLLDKLSTCKFPSQVYFPGK